MMRRVMIGAGLVSAVLATIPTLSQGAGQIPPPAPVREYPVHADGGLIYNPLSRDLPAAQRARWRRVPARTVTLAHRNMRLSASVPGRASAYDVVPIPYSLTLPAGVRGPVAVQAVGFEESARRKGRHLYDLALPGRPDVKAELVGSVSAVLRPEGRHLMKTDLSDAPGVYPWYTAKPVRHSGSIEAGDLVWLRVRLTNIGDTILDAEGMGGATIIPVLDRRQPDGSWKQVATAYNLYYRLDQYIYPGESTEFWFHPVTNVHTPETTTPQGHGLTPGEYRARVRLVYRYYRQHDDWLNMWEGKTCSEWALPFTVEQEYRQTPFVKPEPLFTDPQTTDGLTRYIHTFEEFMTAFDAHQKPQAGVTRGTLYLQVAPWTRHVVLKLVTPQGIVTREMPVAVQTDSLGLRWNPKHPFTIVRNGMREPVIATQSMADMRTNVQIGPWPERHLRERLRQMQYCGINVTAVTSMPWLYDMDPRSASQADSWKYWLDICRDEGMHVFGWGTYPYNRLPLVDIAEWLTGRRVPMEASNPVEISYLDPYLPVANAVTWLYQFRRWGDLYIQPEAGFVPIDVEDSRGWMRQDINIRYPLGDHFKRGFRSWLTKRYGDIDRLNEAWGSTYASVDEIDPEKDGVRNLFGHHWEYTDRTRVFHDWSRAMYDLDLFRTQVRVGNYRDTLQQVREAIPNAVVQIRTEGGNVLVQGLDPADPNPHFRHIILSQRRCALMAEVIQPSGLVRMHSDYTTIPYTPEEIGFLVRRSVQQGIIPAWFPQFDNMRDIVINTAHGYDYTVHYNLPEPRKGCMMHVLTAVYPWWRATYDASGIPGVLWEDLQCDGFVTETQRREMRLFAQHLRAAANRPDALRQRTSGVREPDSAWRAGSAVKRSYQPQGEP